MIGLCYDSIKLWLGLGQDMFRLGLALGLALGLQMIGLVGLCLARLGIKLGLR